MEVHKGLILYVLANHLTPSPGSVDRVAVHMALTYGLIHDAIHHLNLTTQNTRQRYNGEKIELMFDYIERKINNEASIKIGRTGKTLTRANLAEALDDLRENHLRD